jgi:hypothetical protein
MDNPDKLATQGTQDENNNNKYTPQYVLSTTIRKQTQTTGLYVYSANKKSIVPIHFYIK